MRDRRSFLKVGGALAGVGSVVSLPTLAESLAADELAKENTKTHAHQNQPISGALVSATVSFGQWAAGPPRDRFPNVGAPAVANNHQLIPNEVTIRAGGAVNFIIAGFHQVIVYGDGTQASAIDVGNTILPTAGGPPLIADPTNRLYRGLDPSLQPQDRVEVVTFPNAGRYLVICGVLPHFAGGMFGFVRVLP